MSHVHALEVAEPHSTTSAATATVRGCRRSAPSSTSARSRTAPIARSARVSGGTSCTQARASRRAVVVVDFTVTNRYLISCHHVV